MIFGICHMILIYGLLTVVLFYWFRHLSLISRWLIGCFNFFSFVYSLEFDFQEMLTEINEILFCWNFSDPLMVTLISKRWFHWWFNQRVYSCNYACTASIFVLNTFKIPLKTEILLFTFLGNGLRSIGKPSSGRWHLHGFLSCTFVCRLWKFTT
jgi:hypothetical protein